MQNELATITRQAAVDVDAALAELHASADAAIQAAEELYAAALAERDRIAAIRTICNGEFPEIEKEAVGAGWAPEVVTKKVLEALRSDRPAASAVCDRNAFMESHKTRKEA